MKTTPISAEPDLSCTKCGSKNRIVVFRRHGSSGTIPAEPDTRLCAVCAGEKPDRER